MFSERRIEDSEALEKPRGVQTLRHCRYYKNLSLLGGYLEIEAHLYIRCTYELEEKPLHYNVYSHMKLKRTASFKNYHKGKESMKDLYWE